MAIGKNPLYKSISLFLKAAIALASLWYIYSKAFQQNDLAALFSFDASRSYFLALCVVFMLFNWSLEALKWQMLVSRIEQTRFLKALQGVLCGLTVSIFTPNRAGEFAGRIFLLQKANRVEAALLTFAGNAAQLFITFLMPVLGFIVWHLSNTGFFSGVEILAADESDYYTSEGILSGTFLVSLLTFIFTVSAGALLMLFRDKFRNRYVQTVKSISSREWWRLLLLAFSRYVIFFFQFYFLLLLFEVDVTLKNAFIMIPLVFFVITAVPTFALTEIGVRGTAALVFFSMISANSDGILSAALLLWFVNLALPALAGLYFVFELRFFRT